MSASSTNGTLVAAVRQRIERAHQVGRPVPGRRVLAAEMDVSEYAVRRAMEEIGRAPAEPASANRTAAAETGRPEPAVAGDGGRPASPSADSVGAHGDPVDENEWRVGAAEPDPTARSRTRAARPWPLALLALPAFVAIWGGWVGLGQLAGFGVIQLLPGIWDELRVNTAVTLPIGLEVYAAYALRVWLSGTGGDRARRFARISSLWSLGLGAAGQIGYHLMAHQR